MPAQFWYSWRYQLEEFAKTHTVAALDMRGYNLSSIPPNTTDYVMDNLVADAAEAIKVCAWGDI